MWSLSMKLMEVVARLNGGLGTPSSWRSSETPDDLQSLRSLSPLTSCATPASNSSDPGDPCGSGSSNNHPHDSAYTIGVTETTPYPCQFCDKAFPRLSYLKRHEQVHGDQMPFRCDFCHRLFKHKRSRDRHVKLHTGDRKYRCPHCESAFSRSDHLKIHLKTHDNAKPFQCTICNRGYNTAAALTSHMQNHKKGDSPSPAGSHSPHSGLHRNGGRHGGSRSNLARNNLPDGPTFRCLECSAIFGTARELQSHGEMHRERNRTSPMHASASLHAMGGGGGSSSSSNSPFLLPCALCALLCPGPDGLRLHLEQTHRNACLICGEEFVSQQALEKHKKVHESHVPIMNGVSLTTKMDTPLFRPALLTSPGSKLTCGFCAKADFTSFEALQLHIQVLHIPSVLPLNGNSPPSPSVAPPSSSSQQLRSSASTTGSTGASKGGGGSGSSSMYPCEFCTLRFSSVHALQKHTLNSHSFAEMGAKNSSIGRGEPVFCSHCTMGFNSTLSLAEHIRNVHETNLDNVGRSSSNRSDSRKSRSPDRRNRTSESPNDSKMVNGKGSPEESNKNSSKSRNQMDTSMFNGTTPGSQFAHPGTLLCSQCNAGFPDFESFRSHLKTHLDAVVLKFNCPECDEEFPSEDRLDNHLATHFLSTVTEYACQTCLKMFSKPDELQKHLMDLHAYHLYRCSMCKELFDSKVAIQVHFAVKHSNECRMFRCTTCVSAVFTSLRDFQNHVRTNHLMQAKNLLHPFRCLLCDQSFANELQLQLHAGTHKKPYSCTFCDEEFHIEFLLDKHMQTRHSGETLNNRGKDNPSTGVNGASINVIEPTTTSSSTVDMAQNLSMKSSRSRSESVTMNPSEDSTGLGASSATIGSRKELKCDICDATFPSDNALSNHRRQAHNIRTSGSQRSGQTTLSLYCAYCSESCKSRTELENHMKAHTVSPSKHKCNICDEICPSATTLAEHKLTHCKLVSGMSCFVCRSSLKSEEQFYSHFQQHNNQTGNTATSGWPFPCVICRQSLASDVEVQMHAKFHLQKVFGEVPNVQSTELLFPCCVCGRRFESHHLIITGKQDCGHTYMCKDCFHSKSAAVGALVAAAAASVSAVAAATSNANINVTNDVNAVEDLRCVDCQVKFESMAELESHQLTQHNKTYQCIKCQISFGTEAEIQEHVTTHVLQEGTEHECRLCQHVFDSPAKLQCHLIEHTFEGCTSYTCYLCSSVFTSPHAIQQHMLEHGLNARPYDCGQCHQRFFFRGELDHHSYLHENHPIAMETDEKPTPQTYRCNECNETFSNSNNLANHSKKHRAGSGDLTSLPSEVPQEGPLKCSLCPMSFHTSNEMQDHFFNVHGEAMGDVSEDKKDVLPTADQSEARNECPECPEKFSHSKTLAIHMKSHCDEPKPYACPVCGKRFAHRETRKAHVKSHCSGSKQYSCMLCDDQFGRRSRLKEHVKTFHTVQSPTPHQCDSCSGTFASVRLLRLHQTEVHQKLFEHQCNLCGDLYETMDQLDQHVNDTHQTKGDQVPMEDSSDNREVTLRSPGQSSLTSSSGRESKQTELISDNDDCVKNETEVMDDSGPISAGDDEIHENESVVTESQTTLPTEIMA